MQASQLRDLQRRMAGLILEPAALNREATTDFVRPPPHGTAAERLGAYVNGYPARLREALEDTYPALRHLLGASTFGDLILRHRHALPAGGWDLGTVGRGLPSFLAQDELAFHLPFVADLARLEWAVQVAFHARLSEPLRPGTFATLTDSGDWRRTRLKFQAGVAVVESAWPIRDLWEARRTPREAIDVDLRGRPDSVCVHRVDFRVACESIDPRHAAVLKGLLAGETLATALASLTDEDAPLLATWTAGWMQQGLVVGAEPAPR
jgi:hypothetical protein